MSFDNSHTSKAGGLAERAMRSSPAAVRSPYPPNGNTGGSPRQSEACKAESHLEGEAGSKVLPQTTPHIADGDVGAAPRASRAKKTSDDMGSFTSKWFFDWLTVTVQNSTTGKGSRSAGDVGDAEADEAASRLFSWVTVNGLRLQRLGKGSDGYAGGAHLAFDPTGSERFATIRAGHATNMPGLELTGGGGLCADLAPKALAELGPVLVARADVSFDVSKEGLFEELHDLCLELAARDMGPDRADGTPRGLAPPRIDGRPETGETIYFGKGEVALRIYQKDMERASRGAIPLNEADRNLVRCEFVFRPTKGRKAGLAKIARDEGPGALLGTSLWVRQFVERLAVLTEQVRADAADMAVTRVDPTPDPRPISARAAHGLQQYAGTFCKSAIRDIVEDDFEGDWLAAKVSEDDVEARVVAMVRCAIKPVLPDVCDRLGVLAVRKIEEEAERAGVRLSEWMVTQQQETEAAQIGLAMAEAEARHRSGMQAAA